MEEFVVYILFSSKHKHTYIGYTSDLITRFKFHNNLSKKGFTVRFRPWKVIYVEFFNSKKQAMARELSLKMGKGRQWIKESFFSNNQANYSDEAIPMVSMNIKMINMAR